MVLGDDFYGKMMFEQGDVGHGADSSYQSALDFVAGVVGVVENAKFGMPPLAVEIEIAAGHAVELHTPLHQAADAFGSALHHQAHGFGVVDVVAGDEGVGDVLFKIIDCQIRDGRNAALGFGGVGLVDGGFADEGDAAVGTCGRHLQGIAQAGHARTDDQKVKLMCHGRSEIVRHKSNHSFSLSERCNHKMQQKTPRDEKID